MSSNDTPTETDVLMISKRICLENRALLPFVNIAFRQALLAVTKQLLFIGDKAYHFDIEVKMY